MMKKYLDTFCPVDISIDHIQSVWKNIKFSRKQGNVYYEMFGRMGLILRDQARHITDLTVRGQECYIWYIMAKHNGFDYGSVCVFHNYKATEYNSINGVIMQDITKYPIPIVCGWILPEAANLMPKLNSIVQPAVNSIAFMLKLNAIYVRPIGKQSDILIKYYGFQKLPNDFNLKLPCETISTGFERWLVKYL